MVDRCAALDAAHNETTDPHVDDKTKEILATEVLSRLRHLASLVPLLDVFSAHVGMLGGIHVVIRGNSRGRLESVNVENYQACKTVAALRAAKTIE